MGSLLRELGPKPLVSRGADRRTWRIAWGRGTGQAPLGKAVLESSLPCSPAAPTGPLLCLSQGEPYLVWQGWPRPGWRGWQRRGISPAKGGQFQLLFLTIFRTK